MFPRAISNIKHLSNNYYYQTFRLCHHQYKSEKEFLELFRLIGDIEKKKLQSNNSIDLKDTAPKGEDGIEESKKIEEIEEINQINQINQINEIDGIVKQDLDKEIIKPSQNVLQQLDYYRQYGDTWETSYLKKIITENKKDDLFLL